MAESWLPWQCYPDLTLDKLVAIGQIMAKVRDDSARDHRPETGEGPLTLGVAAWERTKFAISQARPRYPWLRIANGDAPGATHFIFLIGSYPGRFYHGTADDPPDRYRRLSYEEVDAAQPALELGQLPEGLALRFAVCTGSDNRTVSVHLIEFSEVDQKTVRSFSIPVKARAKVAPFVSRKEGVSLPPPRVRLKPVLAPQKTNESE